MGRRQKSLAHQQGFRSSGLLLGEHRQLGPLANRVKFSNLMDGRLFLLRKNFPVHGSKAKQRFLTLLFIRIPAKLKINKQKHPSPHTPRKSVSMQLRDGDQALLFLGDLGVPSVFKTTGSRQNFHPQTKSQTTSCLQAGMVQMLCLCKTSLSLLSLEFREGWPRWRKDQNQNRNQNGNQNIPTEEAGSFPVVQSSLVMLILLAQNTCSSTLHGFSSSNNLQTLYFQTSSLVTTAHESLCFLKNLSMSSNRVLQFIKYHCIYYVV